MIFLLLNIINKLRMALSTEMCLNEIKPIIDKVLTDPSKYSIENIKHIKQLIAQTKECERLLNVSSEIRYIDMICQMLLFIIIISYTIYFIYINKINILDIVNNRLQNFRESVGRACTEPVKQTPQNIRLANNVQPALRKSPRRRN